MVFVIHPLTQQSGEPKYTAADFRLTVSNFLTVGTGEVFGAVQGVRSDTYSPLVSLSGSTITVHPHSGIIAPWAGVGAYAYAITSDITVPRPTTGDYYVVLTVEDPSQSHGSEPQGRVDLTPLSTPRESINGLVIARTQGSSINDIANRLRNGTVIEAVSKAELDLIKPTPRAKAWVRFGDAPGEYEYDGSNWKPVNKTIIPSRIINSSYWTGSNARVSVIDDVVFFSCSLRRNISAWSGDADDNVFCTLPAELAPNHTGWVALEPRYGVWLSVGGVVNGVLPVKFNKSASFTLPMPKNAKLDFYAFWHLKNV